MTFDFEIDASEGKMRSGSLRLGYTRIKTPYWAIIHTERKRLIRGINLIHQRPPSFKIHELVFDYRNQNDIQNVLSNNNLINRIINRIRLETREDSENILQFRTSNEIRFSSTQLRRIIQLQANSDRLSVLTIPDPIIGESGIVWEAIMDSALNFARDLVDTGNSETVMPTVSLNQPIKKIERKIYWLLNRKINALALRAVGSFSKRLQRVTEILNQGSINIWIHLFDLSKKYLQLSQAHLVPLSGIDTVSLKKGYPRGRIPQPTVDTGDFPTPEGVPLEVDEEIFELPIEEQPHDLFEGRALGFLNSQEQISSFGHELFCRCPLCRKANYSVTGLIELLSQQDRKALLQVHECYAFPEELKAIQQAIINNEIRNYYESKTLINLNSEKIFNRFPIE